MSTRTRMRLRTALRPVRWVAAVAALGAVLTSCGTMPGAALDVAGHETSMQTVLHRTDTLMAEQIPDPANRDLEPADRSLLNRYQVSDIVRHRLVTQAADKAGIDVSDADVNAFISGNGGPAKIAAQLTIPTEAVHDASYDYLVLRKLADKIPDGGVEITNVKISVDVVSVDNRADAVADRARYLSDPSSMQADTQGPATDESLLTSPRDALVGLFTAPEGEIVLLPSQQAGSANFGYYVVRVTKRTEEPAKLTKQKLQSAQSLDGYLVLASQLLNRYVDGSEVTVNRRFGQWDPQLLTVVPANNGL